MRAAFSFDRYLVFHCGDVTRRSILLIAIKTIFSAFQNFVHWNINRFTLCTDFHEKHKKENTFLYSPHSMDDIRFLEETEIKLIIDAELVIGD